MAGLLRNHWQVWAGIRKYIIYLLFPSFYGDYIRNESIDFYKYTIKTIIYLLIVILAFVFSMLYWNNITNKYGSDVTWNHQDRIISTLLLSIALLLGAFAFYGRNKFDMSDASKLSSWIPFILKLFSIIFIGFAIIWPFHFFNFIK